MPIFEDDDRGRHAEDYELLHNGHVHFFRHAWAGDQTIRDLQALGHVVLGVDLARCNDADAVRAAFIAAVPDWPAGHGVSTWPGFIDGLTDHLPHAGRELVVLVLSGLDEARRTAQPAVLLPGGGEGFGAA